MAADSSDEDKWTEELGIKAGAKISSSKATYIIDKLLGEGGFGAVFRVRDEKNEKNEYAMKVEKKVETRRHSKLKMEVHILKLLTEKEKRKEKSHFTKIVDRGKKEMYFFLIMQLVGPSLADLKARRPEKLFSPGTGIGASMQCLEAIEDLHNVGFIHRDIKPANYACGLEEAKRVVYMLDFGIARKFTNDKDELKTPRELAKFKGTVKFASLSCHKNKEQGRKDDVEQWFYLLCDINVAAGLPWKRLSDKNEVLKLKEDCRTSKRDTFLQIKCRHELEQILSYIDSLQYHDRVDYHYIYDMLKKAATTCGGNVDDPYDWEKE